MRRSLIVLFAVAAVPGLALCQDENRLHRIDTESPNELHELFRYDGHAIPLVSAH